MGKNSRLIFDMKDRISDKNGAIIL